MNFHLAIIADDYELIATFDQMKSQALNFASYSVAAYLMFHIMYRTAHHTTACGSLGTK